MSLVPAIIAGSLISGALSSSGARSAARTSAQASREATAEQRRQFDILQGNFAPYLQAGTGALEQLQGLTGNLPEYQAPDPFQFNLQSDPGYQFALNESMRAGTRGAAAQGKLNSGNLLIDLQNRAAGLASQYAPQAFQQQLQAYGTNLNRGLTEYGLGYQRQQDIYNRLQGLANMGLGSVTNLGQAGMGMASNIGNILQGNAQNQIAAQGQLYGGLNNAIQGGIGNYIGYTTQQDLMNRFFPTSTGLNQYGPIAGGYR